MNKCPICGKEFRMYYGAEWAYKIKKKTGPICVCSWGCMRKWEKNNETKEYLTVNKK